MQLSDVTGFIKILEKEYAKVFESELLESMAMVDSTEYELLKRYIDHAVAQIKNEKIGPSNRTIYSMFRSVKGGRENIDNHWKL